MISQLGHLINTAGGDEIRLRLLLKFVGFRRHKDGDGGDTADLPLCSWKDYMARA